MIIAICIEDKQNKLVGNAHIVTIENDEIVQVVSDKVFLKDENHLALWILRNEINCLYMNNVTTKVKMFCRNWHVDVCDLEESKAQTILTPLLKEILV